MANPESRRHLPLKKIISIYAATTVTAILLVGLSNYYYSLQTNINKEKNHLRHITYRIKDQIDILISDTQKELELIASFPQFSSLPYTDRADNPGQGVAEHLEKEKRLILSNFLNQTSFSRIFITLPNGDRYLSQPFAAPENLRENKNLSDRPYFQRINRINKPVISDRLMGDDHKAAVVIMVPLFDLDREVIGYLGGVCRLNDIAGMIREAGLEDFVQAFVLDSRGNLVVHSREELAKTSQVEYQQRNLFRRFQQFRQNTRGNQTDEEFICRCEEYSQPDDKDWLTSFCRLDNGWGLILGKSRQEIVAGFLPGIWQTTLITGLLFLIVSALGIFFVRSTGLKWLASQKDLEESQQRFKDLVDLLPVMAYELDKEGYISYMNNAASNLTGYNLRDLEDKHIIQLVVDEDRERARKNLANIYAGGETIAHEYTILDRKHDPIPVLVYHRPIIRNDEVTGVRGVAVDISQLKKTENLLRQTEERFRVLYENTPIPCQSLGPDKCIQEVNQAWLETLGYKHEEVVGKNFTTLLTPESKKNFQANFSVAKEKGRCSGVEFNMIKRDNSVILASFNGRVCYNETGNFLQIHCSFQDITEVRKTEREKERYSQGLEKLEKWVKELLSAGSADLYSFYSTACRGLLDLMEADVALLPLVDETGGNFTYAAAAGRQADLLEGRTLPLDNNTLCGWVAAHGEPLRVTDLKNDPRANKEIMRQTGTTTGILAPVYSDDRIVGGLSALRQNSPYDQVDELLLQLFAHRVGTILAKHNLLLSLEEIVEERTRELELTHKQLLQAEKLSAIGSLSASIAHEFNNPLQGIMSIIRGLKKRASLEKEDAELVNTAIKECERLRDLIKSLQEFNRPTSGKYELVDIHETIDHILLLSKKDHQNRGITVETRYDKDIPKIRAVEDQIKQAFLNLIQNAAEACSRGDTITISTENRKEEVVISIADTGIGIDPRNMEHIFEPFFTTKSELRGTGLGLAISYGIIKAHNGDIEIESEPGKETVFTLHLPK
ncbi:MAG: PAS domain S-box protein [Desulfurivibrionaceae bacterium]